MARAANNMHKRREPRYSVEYRSESLSLAEHIGVAAAASELGLHATQIYQWQAKAFPVPAGLNRPFRFRASRT
jgi:transposase